MASLLVVVPSVQAAATRAEYVAQADAICQSQQAAFKQKAKPLRRKIGNLGKLNFLDPHIQAKADKPPFRREFRPAGRLYKKWANSIDATVNQLATLTPFSPDLDLITPWLASYRVDAKNFRDVGRTMASRNVKRLGRELFRLVSHSFKTGQLVAGFGFQRCEGAGL